MGTVLIWGSAGATEGLQGSKHVNTLCLYIRVIPVWRLEDILENGVGLTPALAAMPVGAFLFVTPSSAAGSAASNHHLDHLISASLADTMIGGRLPCRHGGM
jgi:hypothetical protein